MATKSESLGFVQNHQQLLHKGAVLADDRARWPLMLKYREQWAGAG
jgi:hypothetical protein